jgi:hypothetical protein
VSSWSPNTLSALSDYAQLLGLGSLFIAAVSIPFLRHTSHQRLLDHIQAHIEILRPWLRSGSGWKSTDITLQTLSTWSSPGYLVVELNTPSAFIPITFLDSVSIRQYGLKKAIVGLSQQLTSFNQALNKITLMQTASPILSSSLTKKLNQFIQDETLTDKFDSIEKVYQSAKLNNEEELLARWLMSALRSLHLQNIGNITQSNSLISWVNEVEKQLVKERIKYKSFRFYKSKKDL